MAFRPWATFSEKTPILSTSVLTTSDTPSGIFVDEKKSRTATLLSKLSFRKIGKSQTWRPNALRPLVLLFSIFLTVSIMVVLQYFLLRSQHEHGIQFAPKISALPLRMTFLWQYFPIILAVVFSIFWAWIDLETKRLEPYYQLSKPNGALGKDSLLLQYPFDFMPGVPLTALKNRHWSVFFASTVVMLLTWGIVPVSQAIFSTERVTQTFPMTFAVSTSFMPAAVQEGKLGVHYTHSAYGIAMLNETLPPYTTWNYTLAPFKSLEAEAQKGEKWTAPTTLYSLDMQCEEATLGNGPVGTSSLVHNSKSGCSYGSAFVQIGNSTIRMAPRVIGASNKSAGFNVIKEFSANYAGYWNFNGFADYYLEGYCPETANHTFLAVFARNKNKTTDQMSKATSVYCQPVYYSQAVNASVDALTKRPLEVVSLGTKQRLTPDIFNSTVFEAQMNSGSVGKIPRKNALPTRTAPAYVEGLSDTQLSMFDDSQIQSIAAMAAIVGGQSMEKYLNPEALRQSYEKAYRLLFAAYMAEVMETPGGDFGTSKLVKGERKLNMEATVLDPPFTYVVEGLLGLVTLATVALLHISLKRETGLRSDPNTIAGVMSLVADNRSLLADMEFMDCHTTREIEESFGHRRFKLVNDEFQTQIVEINQGQDNDPPMLHERQDTSLKEITNPVRPKALRLFMAIPFVGLFIALAISLGILFIKARLNGLPLPSKNRIVQNILENYIPTAIATLIEPMWVLINRILCMLQPLDELQSCEAPARRSTNLNYNSLPPQLVVFKALRNGHYILSAVCVMTLLANILAVSFSGLFIRDSHEMWNATSFSPPFRPQFVSVDGSIGPPGLRDFTPSGAYHGGLGQDQDLIAESNYTRGTPLPAWTDERTLYLPFRFSDKEVGNIRYKARTISFGAELECEELKIGENIRAALNDSHISFSMSVSSGSCFGARSWLGTPSCSKGPRAMELTSHLYAEENATQKEKDMCMKSTVFGWLRDRSGSCGKIQNMALDATNALFVRCEPRLVIGYAEVLVDARGELQERAKKIERDASTGTDEVGQYFSNDPANIVGQSNTYLFQEPTQAMWHNDTFASDNINYFVIRENNSSRLVDPYQNVPALDDVNHLLRPTYSRLFAIWLGANKENLLVRARSEDVELISGFTLERTERLFLSTAMFAIAEAIICTYVIVAVSVYVRRPGQCLARLPTCIASIIALFAASAAILDMRSTSRLNNEERAFHLEKLEARYGYGSYIGVDGRVHIGIEKAPFVRIRSKSSWFERKVQSFHKGSSM